jgi:hypothetical protein
MNDFIAINGVNLTGNRLTVLPGELTELMSIKELNILDNPLKEAPVCITELEDRGVTI